LGIECLRFRFVESHIFDLLQFHIKALVGAPPPSFSSHVRFGEGGAPVLFPVSLWQDYGPYSAATVSGTRNQP
jgi:hypothetical protein